MQLGWLQASPKEMEGKTRAQSIKERGGRISFPTVGPTAYLLEQWQEMGMVEQGMNGPKAISSQEITNYCTGLCIRLNPWEFGVIRALSQAFCDGYAKGQKIESSPPYTKNYVEFDRKVLANKLANQMRSSARSRPKR